MAVEVLARVGKGIIKAIKPAGVGVTVPPPSLELIYLFIYLFIPPLLSTNKIKTSEPNPTRKHLNFVSNPADFQLQTSKTPTPQKTHLWSPK